MAGNGLNPVSSDSGWRASLKTGWLLATVACTAILLPDFILRDLGGRVLTKGDLLIHFNWAVQVHRALLEGVFYPRWMPKANAGLGEPVFLYYPPLYHLVSSYLTPLFGSVWRGMEAVTFISRFIAGLIVFAICRGGRLSLLWSVIGTVLVLSAPYSAFLLAYAGALPSSAAILPMLVLLYATLYPRRDTLLIDPWVSLSVAWLSMVHVLTAFMVLLCFPVLPVVLSWRRTHSVQAVGRSLARWILSSLLGLGVAAIYLVPALTQLNLITPSAWWGGGWRASFSLPFLTQHRFGHQWWVVQWPLSLISLCCLVVATIEMWRSRRDNDHESLLRFGFLFVIAGWLAMFLASDITYPAWAIFKILQALQFPSRFLTISSLFGILANVFCLAIIASRPNILLRKAFVAAPLVASFALTAALQISLFRGVRPVQLKSEVVESVDNQLGRPEYLPATTEGKAKNWKQYNKAGGFRAFCSKHDLDCAVLDQRADLMKWRVTSHKSQNVILPLFAFPAWSLRANGKKIPNPIDPATGLMLAKVSAGVTNISAVWIGLPIQRTGNWVSLISLCILAGIALSQIRLLAGFHRDLTSDSHQPTHGS